MKKIQIVILFIFLCTALNNCVQDIAGTEENIRKEQVLTNESVKDTIMKLSFRVQHDDMFIPWNESVYFGSMKSGNKLERKLQIRNASSVDTITIYKIEFRNNSNITVNSDNLPIILKPGDVNVDKDISMIYDALGIAAGSYDIYMTVNSYDKIRIKIKIDIN